MQQQVLIATPTTLIGLLWAAHYGWREERIAESARDIAESARELHRRLGRFVEPLGKVGRQLDSAVAAYNVAVGSFDARVVPQVRKIEEAGAASDREVSSPPAVETTARAVTARLAAEGDPAEGELEPARPETAPQTLQTLQALELAPSARISAGARPARRSA